MKITRLTLNGFRGFRLRQIQQFTYKPVTKTQVILGSNGSGKSTCLRELSPLPGNHLDFDKGGRKEIEIEHQGAQYLLQSLFDEEGNRYPFFMDGENLNPGGTITVYKELVKQHFNYTPDIHALLIGAVRFHSMSVAERRNWFMRISETDYTYAIKYYQRLSEAVRDAQGALKKNQERLTAETAKCLTPDDEAVLKTTVSELTTLLDTLLVHRKPRITNQSEAFKAVNNFEIGLQSDITRLETLLETSQGVTSLLDTDALERQQIALQSDLQSYQREITYRCEAIEKWQKELNAATATSHSSLEEVQTIQRNLSEEQETLYARLRMNLHFEDVAAAVSALEAAKGSLEDLLLRLSECPRLDYTREGYQVCLQAQVPLNQTVLKLKAAADGLFNRKQAFEAAKAKGSVDCPKCQYHWYPNYDELQYQQLCGLHQESVQRVLKAEQQEADNAARLLEHTTFFGYLDRYRQLTSYFTPLAPYWKYIETSGKLYTAPSELTASIQMVSMDLRYLVQLAALNKRLEENYKLEALMKNTAQVDTAKLKTQIDQENEQIGKIQLAVRTAQAELNLLKANLGTKHLIDQLHSKITQQLGQRTQTYTALIEDQCVGVLDELIREVKLTVSAHERNLSQVNIQKGIVLSLEQQIKTLEADLKLLKQAQKALSPTEGLIAKGMTTFINHFVEEINAFIAKIWLYPLALVPLAMQDDDIDLDYRFMVRVNDDHTTPDVSKTSMGMKEVIDLAFVAVSMRYLGLTNSPFFLDEFAVSMDVAHRQSAYRAIDLLIESSDYSQVFLVSHYKDGYSSLHASEVLVLCDSHVELPKDLAYNHHVTMI